ncbi:uncharacterized protein LOC113500569 [Trichoplusia ni]|uniref:Uncharacterized protein LOC113500569 n=1 Tax=Trichoplusia ni TaxID=7111 RepID=A0A7E5W9Q0_TRINI|nr:uncharacterized protein LOC113500569 [Trichoplusia ni]
MMKLLIALALIALCHAGPLENSALSRLQRPFIHKVVIRSDNFLLFEFEWTPIESGIWTDPVIGYKMRVWEVPDAPSTRAQKYTMSDGKYTVLVEHQEKTEESMDDTKNLDNNILLEEILTPGDLPRAAFFNVRIGVNFEIRVSAYTRTHQSSYSSFTRMRVLPNKPEETLDSRSITITKD